MPVGAENVYIDSSFYDLANSTEGTADAYIDFFLRVNDNIGAYSIPVSYNTGTLNYGTQDASSFFTTASGTAGYINRVVDYNVGTVSSGIETVSTVYYASISGGPGTTDAVVDYFGVTSGTVGTGWQHADINAIMGDGFAYTYDINSNYWVFVPVSGSLDYEMHYTAGDDVSGIIDRDTKFTMGSGIATGQNAIVDSHFAGYVMYFHPDDLSYQFDAVCCVETQQSLNWESTTISGAVWPLDFDLYSGAVGLSEIDFDSVCGDISTTYYNTEIQTISGTISYHDFDLWCGASNILEFNFDVDLFPLKISNFSLAEDEYTSTSNAICVDVTDDVYNVVTSGTYFILDDTVVSGIYTTYTGITDGYRMCYNPDDNYASFLGSTTLTVHAENDNGDVLERNYYLTSGYLVEYDNRTQDYGYDNQVVVRMTAENFASCPLFATTAYWFTTVQTRPKDLGASIVGVPWGTKDLSASITPDTGLAYLYGKTFRVEVNVRDFAGNRMTPYIFEFRIEDEPN